MSFLDRIRECNAFEIADYRPFMVDGARLGWVGHEFAERLAVLGDVFMVNNAEVALDPHLTDFDSRSAAMAGVLARLNEEGAIPAWRGELYPVTTSFGAPPLMQMERAAIALFGVQAFGVHMNGFVRARDGGGPGGDGQNGTLSMWIGRRARDKPTFPGMLDNLVAGGQPIGLSLEDNLIKECGEEAGIPPALASEAVPVGEVRYCAEIDGALKPDTMFCYDLELPADFQPVNTDGELEGFELWPIDQVAATVRDTRDFKFNCNLVIIDFLVRHGWIGPDNPDYAEIVAGLRQGWPRTESKGTAGQIGMNHNC